MLISQFLHDNYPVILQNYTSMSGLTENTISREKLRAPNKYLRYAQVSKYARIPLIN